MVFSRLFFIFFFLVICIIAYASSGSIKQKNTILLVASLIFYAWGEPLYIILLLISSAINYLCALVIEYNRGKALDSIFTFIAVAFDILALVYYKYSGFIAENINALFSSDIIPAPDIDHMPIGISFFTFQTISYIIDCHWEEIHAEKSYPNFLMYISLFPQLIAGPIVRYSTVSEEIQNRKICISDIRYGLNRFILGLSKKVILADNLYEIVKNIFGEADNGFANVSNATFVGAWLGAVTYAMYIYFDFSGYSDMAIGMGRIFGFHFDENFNHPFICKDVTEFWQRWHISLSTFFRDYLLYVPIFGKRRKYGGLFLVWFCTGMWHGASWNFIIWGLYYGLFGFLEMKIGKKKMKSIPIALRHIYNKLVIIIGFGIFYFEDLGKLGTFLKTLFGFGGNGFISSIDKMSFVNNMFLIILAVICTFPILNIFKKLSDKSYTAQVAISFSTTWVCAFLLLLCSLLLVNSTNQPFLYFRF